MRKILRFCAYLALVVSLGVLCAPQIATAGYTLTIQTNGSGTVSRNPTNSVYPEGSVVTITATANAGWYFSTWTGDASGTTNPLNVTMSSNKVITANFDADPTYVLTLSTNGMGSVSLNPPGGSYLSNSVVTVTESPAAGWVFVNWGGDASGNTNPLSITMDRNKAVTANFAEPAAIDQSPQDVSAGLGDTVAFSVHAVGTPALYYQWWFGGAMLAGATNTSIVLTNIQSAQEGVYSVSVSNAFGVSSNSAMLTITNACIGTNLVTTASEAALRDAIAIGGLIRCCFNGTITLSATIDITNDVTLDAHGRTVIISGNHAVRLFNVSPGVTFSATNLVMMNGQNTGQNGAAAGAQPAQSGLPGQGGAIFDDGGTVRLISCTLASNSVAGGMGGVGDQTFPTDGLAGDGQGGAIFIDGGSLLMDSVNVISNSASGAAGVLNPIGTTDTAGNGSGGAIYITNGSILVVNCNLRSNLCVAPAGGVGASALGGAVFLASGSLTFSNSSLSANEAFGLAAANQNGAGRYDTPSACYGGALAAISGQATLAGCVLTSNVAQGGGPYRYSGTGAGQGGAVFSSATFLASDSSFTGNQAVAGSGSSVNADGSGGALYNLGPASLVGCSFASNLAHGGSAGAFGSPSVNYPGGNGLGGAICNLSQLTMTNCTLAMNSAIGGIAGFPSGVPGSGLGGGVWDTNGICSMMNVTIASNSVVSIAGYVYAGFAAGANVAVTNGTLALENSIIAYPGTNGNAWGTISDGGYNISSDGSANFGSGSSFNFTDPLLLALGNYGGPTLTMALSANSPAVDFGTAVGAPATDQRGFPRPSGLGVDIGAYELEQVTLLSPALTLTSKQGALQLSFRAQAYVTYSLQSSTTFKNWAQIESIGPFANDTQETLTINTSGQPSRFFRLFLHY